MDVTLEISVAMAQFPSQEIARLSWMYRTLGLGYANLGYDSDGDGHSLRFGQSHEYCGIDHSDHDRHKL